MQYFASNVVEGVAELGGDGWSWVEVGRAGWSWVEVGVRFSNTQTLIVNIICIDGNTGNIHVRRTFFVTFIGADCSSCL